MMDARDCLSACNPSQALQPSVVTGNGSLIRPALLFMASVLPSVLPSATFGAAGGFHRYQPVDISGLLLRDAV